MNWIALATISALLSAAAAVAQKRVLSRATALEFSFLVSLVVLAFSLFVPATTDVLAYDGRTLALLVGKSVLGGCAFLLVMMALERNDISSALPMMGLTPALVAVLATFALDQPLRGPEWGGLLLMLAGCALLEARSGQALAQAWSAAFAAGRHRHIVGAIVLFAVSAVADKMLVSGMRVPPFVVMFHQHVVYCALFGILLLARRASAATLAARARENWPLLVTIAVFTIGYRWFQLEATKLGPVALVLATKRTSIVYASLFGGRIFAEERLAMRVAGGVLIVAAGFLFLGRE
ncbi:MAG: EamA family transporter [Candidatus Eisenbacteria bacterium]|nr:EamA family transporter [Candidatus Eisenbacteria bacterium]